jgi:hypothetical protein
MRFAQAQAQQHGVGQGQQLVEGDMNHVGSGGSAHLKVLVVGRKSTVP